MIHRLQRGNVPPKPHIAFYDKEQLLFEHCFTRQGFDGAYTIFYHRHPPHWIQSQKEQGTLIGWENASPETQLMRRHYQTNQIKAGGCPTLSRKLLLYNPDISIWLAKPTESDPTLVSNADSDELVYIFEGKGQLVSPCGLLAFEAGDYVYIPRSLPHRWLIEESGNFFIMEGHSWIDIPEQFRNDYGQMTMEAPYSHRDFKEPQWVDNLTDYLDKPYLLNTKFQNHFTLFEMSHHPLDIIGWDGLVWPYVFPIRNYQPRTGLVHLPPTIHTTFAGGGFVVCSFVPRVVDFHPQAIPCPYPHSSVDCDEVLFYVEGNFTSRKGISGGSISFHPRGLPHGPHPGTYEASIGSSHTSELAVMVDTFKPLWPTENARIIEDQNYNQSWIKP